MIMFRAWNSFARGREFTSVQYPSNDNGVLDMNDEQWMVMVELASQGALSSEDVKEIHEALIESTTAALPELETRVLCFAVLGWDKQRILDWCGAIGGLMTNRLTPTELEAIDEAIGVVLSTPVETQAPREVLESAKSKVAARMGFAAANDRSEADT